MNQQICLLELRDMRLSEKIHKRIRSLTHPKHDVFHMCYVNHMMKASVYRVGFIICSTNIVEFAFCEDQHVPYGGGAGTH